MASASAGWAWMAEVAGEELAKLEAAHPGRFGLLKAELERLVAEPGFDAAFPLASAHGRGGATTTCSSPQPAPPPPAGPVCTQESSTRKRKPGAGDGGARERVNGKRRKRTSERVNGKRRKRTSAPPGGPKDGAEMAIERAQRCLERIRAIKQSLLAAWIH